MKGLKKVLFGILITIFVPNMVKAEGLKVGDYVSMTPTSTSYTISTELTGYTEEQTINPSELTLWRIIEVHDDGSFDAVSEYISSVGIRFKGTVGYANVVESLQTIAAQYANSEYTIGTRMMGYNGQTLSISNTSAFDGSSDSAPTLTSTISPTTGTGYEYDGGVLGDTLYLKDYQLVGNLYKTNPSYYGSSGLKARNVSNTAISNFYWLASRTYVYDSTFNRFTFDIREISASGTLNGSIMRRYQNDSWEDLYNGDGNLRPILTFKSGLISDSGEGTKEKPYTLKMKESKVCPVIVASDFTMNVDSKLDYKKELNNNELSISIEDTSIAQIDSNGVISAKKVGTTKLTIGIEGCESKIVKLNVIEKKEDLTTTKVNEDTKPVETVKNPKTGNQTYYIFGIVLIIVSIISYLIIKKKQVLN